MNAMDQIRKNFDNDVLHFNCIMLEILELQKQ